jgi:hypothetical protein
MRRNSWTWKNFLCEIFNTLISNTRKNCTFNNNRSFSFMIIPTCLYYTYTIYNFCLSLSFCFYQNQAIYLQSIKYANVIIIDEMSMMTNTMLCTIEQRFKQAQGNMNPFTNILLLQYW